MNNFFRAWPEHGELQEVYVFFGPKMHPPTTTLKPCRIVDLSHSDAFRRSYVFSTAPHLFLCSACFLFWDLSPHPTCWSDFFQHLQKIDLAFEYILSFIDRACVFFGSWLDIFTLKKIDLSLYLVWWHFLYF